jgi:sugar phosphate isomerase/epimerase
METNSPACRQTGRFEVELDNLYINEQVLSIRQEGFLIMARLIRKIQVNIPFTMLYESYLDRFITHKLNPEIGLDAAALDRFSLSDFSDIAAKLHEHGFTITLHAPFMDLSPGSPDPAVWAVTRNRFERILQLVPFFKPKTVVSHAGYDERRYWHMRDIWIEKSLEMWSWLGERMRDEGALLMLENVYEHSPDDIRILFENLGDRGVGFCLDTGHQAVFSRVPLEKWVELLGPYLGQLHLHDNSGKQDEHLALGRGKTDFRILFKQLVAIRKEPPTITLEPHREADLWPSLEYLEKVWPW